MKNKYISPIIALAGLALAAVILACAGCATQLEPGGAYDPVSVSTNSAGVVSTNSAPDITLFQADMAFYTAYSTLDAALKLEQTDRVLLFKMSPAIKHSLDAVRPQAALVVRDYTTARAEYLASPTAGNFSSIQGALQEVQNIASSVSVVLSSVTNNVPK